MKLFSRTLISAAILLAATQAFAKQEPSVEDCPPIAMVAAANFVEAQRFMENSSMWGMVSNDFTYNNYGWNVIFGADLPEAKTAQDALEQGQSIFRHKVTLNEPMFLAQDEMFLCLYGQTEGYFVATVNPPVHIPSLALHHAKSIRR